MKYPFTTFENILDSLSFANKEIEHKVKSEINKMTVRDLINYVFYEKCFTEEEKDND